MNEEKVPKYIEKLAIVGYYTIYVALPIFSGISLMVVVYFVSFINGTTFFQLLTK